jgi:hypothetical protein
MLAFLEPSVMGVGAHLDQPPEFEWERFREMRALGEVSDAAAAEARGFAADSDFAGANRSQTGEHPEKRRFSRAIWTDECSPATAGNLERRVMEGDWAVCPGGGGELLG